MGLKCSVLGHKYGEATVEREREEQGSEVVITIQERETCERCGNTRIVSENKEVTAIETPSDIASDLVEDESESETAAAESPPEEEPADSAAEPTDEEAEPSDGWDSVDDPVEAPEGAGIGDDGAEDGEPVDPSADEASPLPLTVIVPATVAGVNALPSSASNCRGVTVRATSPGVAPVTVTVASVTSVAPGSMAPSMSAASSVTVAPSPPIAGSLVRPYRSG